MFTIWTDNYIVAGDFSGYTLDYLPVPSIDQYIDVDYVRIYRAGTSSATVPATTTTSTPSTNTSTTVTTSSTTTTTLAPPSIAATSSGGQLLLGVFLALTMAVGWALRRAA